MVNSYSSCNEITLFEPISYDKSAPLYCAARNTKTVARLIKSNMYFKNRTGETEMTNELDGATTIVDERIAALDKSLENLSIVENNLTEKTKKIVGRIKGSTQKLSDGMVKIQKNTDFDALERHCNLLERAAGALTILSELESKGKLKKILESIK